MQFVAPPLSNETSQPQPDSQQHQNSKEKIQANSEAEKISLIQVKDYACVILHINR